MHTIVITGASDGIGKSAAAILAQTRPDARLILVGRNPDKTQRVAEGLGADYFTADFAELSQVRELAASIRETTDRIDVLANNAGGIFKGPEITTDGFEKSWQVNVVGPWLLTGLLLDLLTAAHANVVATSSIATYLFSRFDPADPETREKFSDNRAYGNAKLGDAMMTAELATRHPGLNPVSFHPGVIASNFASDTASPMKSFYRALDRTGMAGPDNGGKRLAYFAEGTAGVHFERGGFYLRPGLRTPLPKTARHASAIFRDLDSRLGIGE